MMLLSVILSVIPVHSGSLRFSEKGANVEPYDDEAMAGSRSNGDFIEPGRDETFTYDAIEDGYYTGVIIKGWPGTYKVLCEEATDVGGSTVAFEPAPTGAPPAKRRKLENGYTWTDDYLNLDELTGGPARRARERLEAEEAKREAERVDQVVNERARRRDAAAAAGTPPVPAPAPVHLDKAGVIPTSDDPNQIMDEYRIKILHTWACQSAVIRRDFEVNFIYRIVGEQKYDGEDCYLIRSITNPGSPRARVAINGRLANYWRYAYQGEAYHGPAGPIVYKRPLRGCYISNGVVRPITRR